jgi:hypothetical protein
MLRYTDSSVGARVRSRVQSCRSSRNHSIGLDPISKLRGFSLVPCPDCGMARVVEGQTSSGGHSTGGPSTYEPRSSSLGPSASRGTVPPGKKKSIFNFLSQGLFACFNVGKHNAQEICAHRQHVDEQLIKLETR